MCSLLPLLFSFAIALIYAYAHLTTAPVVRYDVLCGMVLHASDSYPNVHMPSHSHHNKTHVLWYAYEVQAALCDAVKGDACAHSHSLIDVISAI